MGLVKEIPVSRRNFQVALIVGGARVTAEGWLSVSKCAGIGQFPAWAVLSASFPQSALLFCRQPSLTYGFHLPSEEHFVPYLSTLVTPENSACRIRSGQAGASKGRQAECCCSV